MEKTAIDQVANHGSGALEAKHLLSPPCCDGTGNGGDEHELLNVGRLNAHNLFCEISEKII